MSAPVPFPIIGIGASSGGLEALADMLRAVPASLDAALVLVLHRAEEAEDLLAHVLRQRTELAVVGVPGPTPLASRTLFIAPPGASLAFQDDRLVPIPVEDKRTPPRVIDDFFRELGLYAGDRAAAVILSGALDDGSQGIRQVKECGGLTIVQDPDEAQVDSMPRHALETGDVDLTLPAEAILGAAADYFASWLAAPDAETLLQADYDASVRDVFEAVREITGHEFEGYKDSTVARRLQRRMGLRGVSGLVDYLALLRAEPAEAEALARDLLIGVTSFFRDRRVWAHLRQAVLPDMIRRASLGRPLRAWVVGCASGEEAYSLAMLLAEGFREAKKEPSFQLFATDIEEGALAKARLGRYADNALRDIGRKRLERFFVRKNGSLSVVEDLREHILFARHNVLGDPPFSNQDLICCRNVLIYFSTPLQRRVLSNLHFALRDGGLLLLGKSEGLSEKEDLFRPVPGGMRLFERIGRRRLPQQDRSSGGNAFSLRPAPLDVPAGGADLKAQIKDLLLERFPPTVLVVNSKLDVVHFSGALENYLSFPAGPPSANAIDLLREGLRVKIQGAARKALKERATIAGIKAKVRRDGGWHPVLCDLEYLTRPAALEGMLLIRFSEPPQPREVLAESRPADLAQDAVVRDLEAELKETKAELKETICDLEASLGELRLTNEELLSMNEEYQSSIEELETSKEEAQSLNEELNTVNAQLTMKLAELESLQKDLTNFFDAAGLPIALLDADKRLRRATPAFEEAFPAPPGVAADNLEVLARQHGDVGLVADLEEALLAKAPLEREVALPSGSHYLRRLLPYWGHGGGLEGVVLTYVDITALRRSRREVVETKKLLEVVVAQSPIPLAVIAYPEGTLRVVNTAFLDLLGLDAGSWPDSHPALEAMAQWQMHHPDGRPFSPEERPLTQAMLGLDRRNVACRLTRADGLERWIMASYGPVFDAEGQRVAGVIAFVDITELKRTEADLVRAKEAAEAASVAKNEFLGNVSHELRTPLNGVLGSLQLLEITNLDTEQRNYVGLALRSSRILIQLLGDILDLSMIEAGKLRLVDEKVRLRDLVASVVDALRREAESKGVSIRTIYAPDAPDTVRTDPVRLRQVLFNLLGNAVKFSDKRQPVDVEVGRLSAVGEAVHLLLSVRDRGIGIPEDRLDDVFEPFTQVDGAYSRKYGGTGLGLGIVCRLVPLLGGCVQIESRLGEGTEVQCSIAARLPCAQPDCPSCPGPGQAKPAPAPAAPAGARVLVVDDDESIRNILGLMLDTLGYEYASVEDGDMVLDALAGGRFDVVLMDIQMPRVSGLEATRRIRGSRLPGVNPAIPVVAVTAHAMAGDRERFLAAGLDEYVPKPVDRAVLAAVLHHVLTA